MPIFAIAGAIMAFLTLVGISIPNLELWLWLLLFLHLVFGGFPALPWIRREPR